MNSKPGLPTGDTLFRFHPIGWYGVNGSGLAEGAEWAKCPECDEECIWFKGEPTALHKGSRGD